MWSLTPVHIGWPSPPLETHLEGASLAAKRCAGAGEGCPCAAAEQPSFLESRDPRAVIPKEPSGGEVREAARLPSATLRLPASHQPRWRAAPLFSIYLLIQMGNQTPALVGKDEKKTNSVLRPKHIFIKSWWGKLVCTAIFQPLLTSLVAIKLFNIQNPQSSIDSCVSTVCDE